MMCRASAASTSGELFVETIAYESVCRLALSVLRFHSLLESCDDCLYVCRRRRWHRRGAPAATHSFARKPRAATSREAHQASAWPWSARTLMPRGMEAVCALLRAIDCEEYAEACRNSGYDDAEYLLSMKQADLDEFASAIGMLKGHQKKMERMLQQRPMSQSAQQLATDATATLLRLALGENVELRQRLNHPGFDVC